MKQELGDDDDNDNDNDDLEFYKHNSNSSTCTDAQGILRLVKIASRDYMWQPQDVHEIRFVISVG